MFSPVPLSNSVIPLRKVFISKVLIYKDESETEHCLTKKWSKGTVYQVMARKAEQISPSALNTGF